MLRLSFVEGACSHERMPFEPELSQASNYESGEDVWGDQLIWSANKAAITTERAIKDVSPTVIPTRIFASLFLFLH